MQVDDLCLLVPILDPIFPLYHHPCLSLNFHPGCYPQVFRDFHSLLPCLKYLQGLHQLNILLYQSPQCLLRALVLGIQPIQGCLGFKKELLQLKLVLLQGLHLCRSPLELLSDLTKVHHHGVARCGVVFLHSDGF